MFSLFLVASFVLPTVLGNCCLPDKMSGLAYEVGIPVPALVMADFNLNKYSISPGAGDVEVVLNDINTGKKYTKYHDGSCTAELNPFQIRHCISDSFKDLGENILGMGLNVRSYGVKLGGITSVMTVTDDCLPVMLTRTVDGVSTVQVYANISTSIIDYNVLNQDVSDCKMKA